MTRYNFLLAKIKGGEEDVGAVNKGEPKLMVTTQVNVKLF
jgi:hypothetical protein